MKRQSLLTLLAAGLLLASFAYPTVVAREHKEVGATETPTKTNRGKGGPPSNESEQPRQAGHIVQNDPTSFDGRYVDFVYTPDDCSLTDVSVFGLVVLAKIQLPRPCEAKGSGGPDDHGASIRVRGGDASVRLHDAPNGLIQIQARPNASVMLTPASGAQTNSTADGFEFTIGNLTGLLRLDNASAASWNVTQHARFWVHPLAGGSPERVEIREAIKERKVAGEVDVLLENGTLSAEVFAYEDVLLKADRRNDTTFRFLVDGNLTSGRTFVINLGPGVFQHEGVGLRYWDLDETSFATEVPITMASGLEDVLEILPDEGPEYWVTDDAAGKHVLVAVPHFSVHVFEIASLPPEIVPIVLYGLAGGLMFVGLGAIGMFRRRPIR